VERHMLFKTNVPYHFEDIIECVICCSYAVRYLGAGRMFLMHGQHHRRNGRHVTETSSAQHSQTSSSLCV
jgi:hypothetical protein